MTTSTSGVFKLGRLFGKTGRNCPLNELRADAVQSVWPDSQTLRVVAGNLWVSLNGLDMVLEEGGELYLPSSSQYPAVLSNLSKRPVFYEFK